MEMLTAICGCVMAVQSLIAVSVADDAYAREARAFLANRDKTVQPRQIAEIWKAARGETNDLAAVRSARNVLTPLPEGVTAEWVTSTMRLYRLEGEDKLPLLV